MIGAPRKMKERAPMKKATYRRTPTQIGLFHPAPRLPAGKQIPTDARQQVITLIARMLRKHLGDQMGRRMEAGNE
jgi:hypothetical protein